MPAQWKPRHYVLAPIVRAYRDQKRFAEAERWAREGERRFPIDSTWPKLLGLVLADQKLTSEAIALLEPWAATQPHDPEIWIALGYAAVAVGRSCSGTLRAYGQALRLQPNNREAADAMAAVLLELGAPFAAGAALLELDRALGSDREVRSGQSVAGSVADFLGICPAQGPAPDPRSATSACPTAPRPRRRFRSPAGNNRALAAESDCRGALRRRQSP